MTTLSTIESFSALINNAGTCFVGRSKVHQSHAGNAPLSLHSGEILHLPAGRHISVVCGRLWLTHHKDSRDHFPRGGESFDTTNESDSVIQALADSIILIQ